MSHNHSYHHSGCCGCSLTRCSQHPSALSRRDFIGGVGTASALGLVTVGAYGASEGEPEHRLPASKTLIVQPVLIYSLAERREATSWRGWGGLHTQADIADEKNRIAGELKAMQAKSEFPLEIRPLLEARNPDEAGKAVKGDHDVMLLYAASSWGDTLEKLTDPKKNTIVFVRHKSGPVYLWYEIIHNRYLRKTVDEYGEPGMTPKDVVVDSHDEVLWRLRSLYGLKNTMGKRIVAIGGPSGWGKGGQVAPQVSRDLWKMDIQTVTYPVLGERIKKARGNEKLIKYCKSKAAKYLDDMGVSLHTSKEFVEKAFVLTEVFKGVMDDCGADAITINSCMGTIMPMSETTACLPLSLLNDDGYLAFCESDFVVIPSGILLHYISGKPVFLNDPTYPHDGVVTLAHCTAPRKNDGKNMDEAKILTHFESDYGAAPKVEMRVGQNITVIDPDFQSKRWLGFDAEIIDNPFLDICRSQIDIQMNCCSDKLNEETRGFHWMVCYGNYLKETGYAVQKAGVDWLNLS